MPVGHEEPQQLSGPSINGGQPLRGFGKLTKLLRRSETVLIIGHQNADPDAVCSAYAFSVLARKLNRKLTVRFASPDGVSRLSKQILESVPLEAIDSPTVFKSDLIVTVDTNTLQQLGNLKDAVIESARPLVMIDHHAPHPENARTAALVLCDEAATSTCEMILEMYQKTHLSLNRLVARALLIGLLVETGHLSIATRRTFKSAYDLVKAGADPEEALVLTRVTMDESERIARVKSAQRLRLERVNRWLVALSEVGSYHASAARALIALGAHLAVVAGKRDDELTVSFRATHDFTSETGMHLGTDLANPLGVRMNGMGGGHATAAGANVKGDVNDALKLALTIVREFLSHPSKHNTGTETNAQASSQSSVITQK
jgi:nanoRNase/pAp phosphatase (c-di-AMP/oligoRNAs hydrolase)